MEIHANLWEIFGSHLIKKLKTLKIIRKETKIKKMKKRLAFFKEMVYNTQATEKWALSSAG